MLPDVPDQEGAVFAYLLFKKAIARTIKNDFKKAVEEGSWGKNGLLSLTHENHVSTILSSLEEKGLTKLLSQTEIAEIREQKRRRGRPRKGKSKRGSIGKYYAVNPKFFVDLIGPKAKVTEEDAKAFLQVLEKFSPGGPAVIKTLGTLKDHNFNTTIMGYLRCLAGELFCLFASERIIMGHKLVVQGIYKKVQDEIQYAIQIQRDHTRLMRSDLTDGKHLSKMSKLHAQYERELAYQGKPHKHIPSFLENPNEDIAAIDERREARSKTSSREILASVRNRNEVRMADLRYAAEEVRKQTSSASKRKFIQPEINHGVEKAVVDSVLKFCSAFVQYHDNKLWRDRLEEKGLEIPTDSPTIISERMPSAPTQGSSGT